ncbi:MAG: hypothetical protein K0S45_2336 [Nitrospira sp.]|jgi:hypothetical protein|nr:hypothetical protein [Nitrospira sp.]
MKIRKKAPRLAFAKSPLYLIGYRDFSPSIEKLKIWYDLHYGGPLTCRVMESGRGAHVNHGPWHAHLLTSIPEAEAAQWRRMLSWDHPRLEAVAPAGSTPSAIVDAILVTARLARGLTLLSQGTAFDMVSHEYSNPSDWNDRPLDIFHVRDHVFVQHSEADDLSFDWFYTLGLSKFGLDELEVLQPRGLPEAETMALLISAADEVLRIGQNQKMGHSLDLPARAQTIRFITHRTAAPTGRMVAFRQITTEAE